MNADFLTQAIHQRLYFLHQTIEEFICNPSLKTLLTRSSTGTAIGPRGQVVPSDDRLRKRLSPSGAVHQSMKPSSSATEDPSRSWDRAYFGAVKNVNTSITRTRYSAAIPPNRRDRYRSDRAGWHAEQIQAGSQCHPRHQPGGCQGGPERLGCRSTATSAASTPMCCPFR